VHWSPGDVAVSPEADENNIDLIDIFRSPQGRRQQKLAHDLVERATEGAASDASESVEPYASFWEKFPRQAGAHLPDQVTVFLGMGTSQVHLQAVVLVMIVP